MAAVALATAIGPVTGGLLIHALGPEWGWRWMFLINVPLGVAYPVATTVAYTIALATAFVVNRYFNFESHGHAGKQSVRYVVVVSINYLAFILGLNTGLTMVGVPFVVARLTAGLCEAVYMYLCMRFIVFRHGNPATPPDSPLTRGR